VEETLVQHLGFLSASQIVNLVKSSDIRIAYYAVSDEAGKTINLPEKRFVNLDGNSQGDDTDRVIRDYFYRNLEPDSMIFHVGPYASVESHRRSDKQRTIEERGSERILSIKKSENLTIYPHEFCLVGTNEYIEVTERVGASLYSNVRNTDVGISHISTMIDPSWKGKLQVGITNLTGFTKQLNYLDALCAVRFHEIEISSQNHDITERFQRRRPHFGSDWWSIEQEPGRTFFPKRKEYSLKGKFEEAIKLERRLATTWALLKKSLAALGIVTIVSVIFFIAKIDRKISDTSNLTERLVKVEQKALSFQEIEKKFQVLYTGNSKLNLVAGQSTYQISIPFPLEQEAPPFVAVTVKNIKTDEFNIGYKYSTSNVFGRDVYTSVIVTIDFSKVAVSNVSSYSLSWLIVTPYK
jgi:deoxycytidine triphosphate deaminase